MITLEQAKKIIKDQVKILKEEKVCLNDSLFRILSEKIVSDRDYPPFDKAQMDGLACKQNDRKKKLKIIEEIPAGKIPQKIINSGECAKIMTGAVMPEGADCVIMVEQAEFLNENEVIFKGNDTEKYCYKKGSDLKRGDTVLTLGEKITSQHIAILSSVGITEVPVFKKPNVAVITSGNEIVNAGISPQTEQIRDCNSPMLLAQLNKLGISGRFYGIARDEYDSMKELTLKALDDDNQVIIFSAAMSMGDYDFGPRLFKDIGADIKFEKIAFQPGKPTVFAVCNGKYIFGLPGNPVSTFTTFELLVRPFLYNLMGMEEKERFFTVRLNKKIIRKKCERLFYHPIRFVENDVVEPLDYHGSSHVDILTKLEGWLPIEIGTKCVNKDEQVKIRCLHQ